MAIEVNSVQLKEEIKTAHIISVRSKIKLTEEMSGGRMSIKVYAGGGACSADGCVLCGQLRHHQSWKLRFLLLGRQNSCGSVFHRCAGRAALPFLSWS